LKLKGTTIFRTALMVVLLAGCGEDLKNKVVANPTTGTVEAPTAAPAPVTADTVATTDAVATDTNTAAPAADTTATSTWPVDPCPEGQEIIASDGATGKAVCEGETIPPPPAETATSTPVEELPAPTPPPPCVPVWSEDFGHWVCPVVGPTGPPPT
jgi:hypothetical protein